MNTHGQKSILINFTVWERHTIKYQISKQESHIFYAIKIPRLSGEIKCNWIRPVDQRLL